MCSIEATCIASAQYSQQRCFSLFSSSSLASPMSKTANKRGELLYVRCTNNARLLAVRIYQRRWPHASLRIERGGAAAPQAIEIQSDVSKTIFVILDSCVPFDMFKKQIAKAQRAQLVWAVGGAGMLHLRELRVLR